jgi:photosynthetic reaction center cytochrome c subunit
MSVPSVFARLSAALLIGTLAAALTGCERPPMDSVQHGYRGTGMVQVYNPRAVEALIPANQPTEAQPIPPDEGPRAKEAFKNVKVLGDLSAGAFTRLMVSMTTWVAPNEGCGYCHALPDFADDSKYTKVVARRMIEMTQAINSGWKTHVAQTGVTCYTCHRGQPVPAQSWTAPVAQDKGADFIGNRNGQNEPVKLVGLAALPNDPLSTYLLKPGEVRVAGQTSLPTGHVASIQATESTYGFMVHLSQSLGVNCTYCHNSRSFGAWDQSTPKRTVAWHGIRMVRALNGDYLVPLTDTFPPERKGPNGDVAKVNCATCHQGAYKPLFGAPMAKD